jgi:hypothetical protein
VYYDSQCGGCKQIAYCGPEHQRQHWKTHKPNCCIPGTRVPRSSTPSPNPLDPSLSYPPGRSGKSAEDPVEAIAHFKREKSGKPKMRLLNPGKLTPFVQGEVFNTPYAENGSKQVPLVSGKYRHIASYSLKHLLQLGWDGAKYSSSNTIPRTYVPFFFGYDSDPDNAYAPVDVAKARQEGLAGLQKQDVGLYMKIPTSSAGGKSIVRMNPN